MNSIIEEMENLHITDVGEYTHMKEQEALIKLGLETDEMKDIPGLEGKYAATKHGKIWSYKTKRFLKACGEKGNYQIVSIQGKSKFVHRLVAMAWLPNPDNLPDVNHTDEQKDNNCLSNLEWCSRKYNLKYSDVIKKRRKPVYCIELDKTFPSIRQAASQLNLIQNNLSTHLSRNSPKSMGGYHFKYAD